MHGRSYSMLLIQKGLIQGSNIHYSYLSYFNFDRLAYGKRISNFIINAECMG